MRNKSKEQSTGARSELIIVVAIAILSVIDALTHIFDVFHLLFAPTPFLSVLLEIIIDVIVASIIGLIAITLLRKSEVKQRESEQRFKILFEGANDGMILADTKTRMFYMCNRAMSEMLGYEPDEIKRIRIDDIHPKDALPLVLDQFRKQVAKEISIAENLPVKRKNGSIFYADIVATPLLIGGKACLFGTFRDITQRKKAEESLRISEERYRLLFERNLAGGFRTTVDGRILDCNESFVHMLGYDSKEELFSASAWDFYLEKKDREKFIALIQEQKVLINYEICHKRKDGSILRGIENVSLLSEEDQGSPVMEGTLIDITERKMADEALRASEEKYRAIVENATDQIFTLDRQCRFIAINKTAAEISRKSVSEMVGKSILQIFPKETAAQFSKNIEEVFETGQSKSVEERMNLGGRVFFNSSTLNPIIDDKGNVVAVTGIVRDITESKRAEFALQQSQRELTIRNKINNILLSIPDEEMYREVLQVIVEVMQSKYGLFGYIDQDGTLVCPSLSRDVWEKCNVPDKNLVLPHELWGGIWGRALIEKKTFYSNQIMKVPEGHVPLSRAMVVPMIYQEKVIGVVMVADKTTDYDEEDRELLETITSRISPVLYARLQRDIKENERNLADKALKESEEKYRELFNNAEDVIFLHGLTDEGMPDRFIEVNDLACKRLGYTREEFYKMSCKDIEDKEISIYLPAIMKELLEQGHITFEAVHISKDGLKISVEINSHVFDLKEKRVVLSIIRDISERKGLQQKLMQAEKLASVGTLAYGVAHEFNNSLAGIMANAELGLISGDPQRIKKCFETIVSSSQRASNITKNLLAFSRGKETKKELIDITEPLKSVLAITHTELEKLNIELVEEFKLVPEILCDAGQLSEVFLNMITNARDAMRTNGGTLTLQVDRYEDNIRIIFRDTGTGIPEEIKKRIFEPFITTKGAIGKGEIPGTGLGLFFTYGIINSYQGRIEVESEAGKGTQFTILIPVSINLPHEAIPSTEVESLKT